MGERVTTTSRPGSGQLGGLGKGSGALQDTAPSLFELEGPREKAGIGLLSNSLPEDHHSSDLWLNSPLTVAP